MSVQKPPRSPQQKHRGELELSSRVGDSRSENSLQAPEVRVPAQCGAFPCYGGIPSPPGRALGLEEQQMPKLRRGRDREAAGRTRKPVGPEALMDIVTKGKGPWSCIKKQHTKLPHPPTRKGTTPEKRLEPTDCRAGRLAPTGDRQKHTWP